MSSYDATEIALEVEKQKKDPHFLDQIQAKDNSHNKQKGQADADDVEKFLPSVEQQARHADDVGRMLNTATRAGAGGTKAGLVGLRPSGGIAASKFIEDNVGTGRIPKDPNPAETNTAVPEESKQYRADTKPVSVALYDRCMDCMKPVPKDDVWANLTMVPDFSGVLSSPQVPEFVKQECKEEAARWAALKLRPGEGIGYLEHASCVTEALNRAKRKRIVIDSQGTTQGEKEFRERALRIGRQVKDYIAKERQNPDTDVFYGEAALR
jgi:hypothetical protein